MSDQWESEIGAILTELADVQGALLETLHEKRRILAANDQQALVAVAVKEQSLIERLQAVQSRRQELLKRAGSEGLPSDSIRSLSAHLPSESRDRMQANIRDATERSRLLQHQSLTNWVLVQRTLLHLSQMIEIIATGGQPRPTYGKGSERAPRGTLVDRAA
jgi:hypothetical protein